MSKPTDLVGQKYGRLTVIEQAWVNGVKFCVCMCECGKETVVNAQSLVSGRSRSCGCLRRESTSARSMHDLSGLRFGRLVVIERVSKTGDNLQYLCKCDCGNEKIVSAKSLKRGKTKSCGCLQKERYECGWGRDLAGSKFGRLTVLERISKVGTDEKYRCVCECGNYVEVFGGSLVRGNTQSCGCLQKEATSTKNTIHGLSKTRLYHIWSGMRQRCNNPNNSSFPRYGGRGICVCKEWDSNFMTFRDWAIESGYQDDLSIDRIDTNGDYCPDNCRWSTPSEQARNRRSNVYVEYKGDRLVLKDFSRIAGKNRNVVSKKLKQGSSAEKIIEKLDAQGDKT